MSEAELHQLLFDAVAEARSNFDFWLSITFAVLVGGHYTFGRLNQRFRRLALSLYGFVALAFFLRWLDASSVVQEYTSQLDGLGSYVPFEQPVSHVAWALQSALIFVGSLAMLFFLGRKTKEAGHS
ncbi:MAG: hypothetical protein AAGG55_15820 [Pseudomonadota bacterium]